MHKNKTVGMVRQWRGCGRRSFGIVAERLQRRPPFLGNPVLADSTSDLHLWNGSALARANGERYAGTGKGHDELVDSFQTKIKHQVEMFGRNFLKGKTIDDYKRSHPESFEGRRFIACHQCGGRSVWVKQMGSTRYGIHNQHICRTCGVALWRSNL